MPPLVIDSNPLPLDPLRSPSVDRWGPRAVEWPEYYIDPVFDQILDLSLPIHIRQGLNIDSGYDRANSLVLVTADYFLPLKAWSDKSIFLNPRVSLTSQHEVFSIGAGLRKLLTGQMLIGFYAGHDWLRPRATSSGFVRLSTVGLELAALPGSYSDLKISANAYLPANENELYDRVTGRMLQERFFEGADLSVGFNFPEIVDWLNARFDGRVQAFRAASDTWHAYSLGLTLASRDGRLGASVQHNADSAGKPSFSVMGNLNLPFDWKALVEGSNPFPSAQFAAQPRYCQGIQKDLYARNVRRFDVPLDRRIKPMKTVLLAQVNGHSVRFSAAFTGLPHERITVQIAQSPWRDFTHLVTDGNGYCNGRVDLKAGTYKLRLIHKPSGKVSAVSTVNVGPRGH